MDYSTIIASCGAGIGLGVAYGLVFIYQHTLQPSAPKNLVVMTVINVARLLSFAFVWYFILKTPLLNSILVLTVFFVSFWAIILSAKGRR